MSPEIIIGLAGLLISGAGLLLAFCAWRWPVQGAPNIYYIYPSRHPMVLTPELLATFARDVVKVAHPDLTSPMLAEAAAAHRQRIMEMTGRGVIPGVPAVPEFTVKRPSMEERAIRRAERRATNSAPVASGTPEDERTEVDPQ